MKYTQEQLAEIQNINEFFKQIKLGELFIQKTSMELATIAFKYSKLEALGLTNEKFNDSKFMNKLHASAFRSYGFSGIDPSSFFFYEKVKPYFEKYELNKKLKSELLTNKTITKKFKI